MSLEEIGALFGDDDNTGAPGALGAPAGAVDVENKPSQPVHAPSSTSDKAEARSAEVEGGAQEK